MEGHKGGEVRRVHVLYFLSRNGAVEQPHLIRVHHLHRSGVYLRDVKRWLAELRGMDMPDSFAWSYKRRYKSGYVWQDLMDDELITPISDNEYVLKGSELSSKTDFALDTISSDDDEAKQSPDLKTSPESLHTETDKPVSPKLLSEPDQESPGTLPPPPLSGSEMSDDSAKRASIIKIDLWKQEAKEEQQASPKESSASDSNSNKLHSPKSNKLRSQSGRRTTKLFRNLFRCGWAETDNSALLTVQRQERYQAVSGGSYKRGKMADMLRD